MVLRDPAQRAYDREHRSGGPAQHRDQHRTRPAVATVVIGTVNQAKPAWICLVEATPTRAIVLSEGVLTLTPWVTAPGWSP
jgi:hypothetical protein